jgi:arylsulfatase A
MSTQSNGIRRHSFLYGAAATGAVASLGACSSAADIDKVLALDPRFNGRPPNIVLVNCDDMGWGDLGCYGNTVIKTPNIDALAERGVRFTDFYACDSVCTPSRAGMLTGRYPKRMKLDAALMSPNASFKDKLGIRIGFLLGSMGLMDYGSKSGVAGLNDFEVTVADALRLRGYHTAIVGKWHLGDYSQDKRFNPLNHGFMSNFGTPHSNDILPFPLYRDYEQLEADIQDISKLTGLYTDEAIKVIDANKDKPFFVYLAHHYPHRPLAASKDFKGKSAAGLYGDTVEEIDWNVGRLMGALRKNGLEQNTLVLFTSDNGPWYEGSAGGLRGRKGQSFEGGFRVPLIASWPGKVAQGEVCSQPCINLDLFNTCLELAGVLPPRDRVVDGTSIAAAMVRPEAPQVPHELFFHHIGRVEAMRAGDWKFVRSISHYVYPMPVNEKWGKLSKYSLGPLPLLFNVKLDPGESYNLADRHPERVQAMSKRLAEWDASVRADPVGLKAT